MKLLFLIISPVLFLFVQSCENSTPTVPKESITIVENIILGSDIDSMYLELKERGAKTGTFYTSMSFNDYSEANDNIIGMYYTDVFNLSQYRSPWIHLNHHGFLYPIKLTGTNRLLGMHVLLVNAQDQIFTSNVKLGFPSAIQEINELLINDIEELFVKKYGKPTYKSSSKFYPVFHLEGNQIKEYSSTDEEGEYIIWENEFMTVEFYKGFKSFETSFDPVTPQYLFWSTIGGEPETVEPKQGDVYSYTMPYITYKLKDTTLKILGLEKKLNI